MGKSLKMFLVCSVVLAALVFSFAGENKSLAADKSVAKTDVSAKQMQLSGPFVKEKGFCWTTNLSKHKDEADSVKANSRSKLVLYENGKPLGSAHAMHDEIRTKGKGRYSHWADTLYFSTSDNSDPNKNGKKYTFSVPSK